MMHQQWILDGIVVFNKFVIFYFLTLNTFYLLLVLLSLGAVHKFVRRTFFSDYRQILESEMTWPISVIVPARDEEVTIVETVRSLMRMNYAEFVRPLKGLIEDAVTRYGYSLDEPTRPL